MLLILLQCIYIVFIIFNSKHRKILSLYFLVFSIVFGLAIIIFQLDVLNLGLFGTYGSDETNYYIQTLLIINNGYSFYDFTAPLYYMISYLVLITSPTYSIIYIRIFNYLLYFITITHLYSFLRSRITFNNKQLKYFNILYLVSFLNGIVIWTVIRNLKDGLYFNLIILYYILIYLLSKSKINFKNILKLFALIASGFWMFSLLRPSGGYSFIFLFVCTYLYAKFRESNNRKKIIYVSSLIAITFFVLQNLNFQMLFAFRELIYTPLDSTTNFSLLFTSILEFFRFILGPGPINSFRQILFGDVFLVSTSLGDVLIFLGSIMWWIFLFILLLKIITDKKVMPVIKEFFGLFAMMIFIVATYTYVYGGTGDTRLRAIMYVLAFATFLPTISGYQNIKITRKKDGNR